MKKCLRLLASNFFFKKTHTHASYPHLVESEDNPMMLKALSRNVVALHGYPHQCHVGTPAASHADVHAAI